MEKQVKLFLDFLKDDKKLSDNTLQSYRRDIEQYEKYVSDNKINYLKVTEETILEYMEYLREENKKENDDNNTSINIVAKNDIVSLIKNKISKVKGIDILSNDGETDFCSQINLGAANCKTKYFSIL